ncbi:MAG: lysylphosphatidylglycerol synthase transmembrane domain-containing protein [Chloroflexota bacterium]
MSVEVTGGTVASASGVPVTRLGRVLRGLVWSGLAALVAAIALGVWGDWGQLAAAFGRFSWTAFPVALLLTLVNATLRFGKWHYYVRRIGARPTWRDSALIFVAGFALSVTPGKTGEFLKAYLLHRRCGAPAWKAAPITLAERATDGFAVLLLAGTGLSIVWRSPWPVAACAVATIAGCVLLAGLGVAAQPERAWRPPGRLGQWGAQVAQRPMMARALRKLRESGAGAAAILDPKSLFVAVGLGVISWGAESVALWNVLTAFDLPATGTLFGTSLAALNAGTLAGAVSLLPGGAGAAEATIAAILVQQTDREVAAAATLLIRLCTLWFGAILGIGALVALRDSLAPALGADLKAPAPMSASGQ